jgi:AcrR family transcriptional regulator
MKKTRARSVEAKEIIYKKILKEGKDLFLEFGSKNFTMRALASRLGLAQGSLYTYIKSKRELWYAIIHDDLQQIEYQMENIIRFHKGKKLDLLEKLVRFFFETIKSNNQFLLLMFKTNPPSSNKVGSIERQFEVGIIRLLDQTIKEASMSKELKMENTSKLALYLWNLMYGNAILPYTDIFGPKENLLGYSNSLDYYTYVIELVKKIIISLKKK